jgi:hypothetical protein
MEVDLYAVIPAKAGIHGDVALMTQSKMDSRFRGNDGTYWFQA